MRNTALIIRLGLAAVLIFLFGLAAAAQLTTDEVLANARENNGEEKIATGNEELSSDQVIANARKYLGAEEKLENIRTIQYQGVFESPLGGGSGYISIYLRKPLMQRMEVANGSITETTAINDFEGWKRRVDNNAPDDWAFVILNLAELKSMRANTWENLNFFTGIERLKGRVINKGRTRKDSRNAYLLIFEYDEEIYYERYFDAETGELISTINKKGVEIKEVGEIMVDGIRFPEKVITLVNGEIANVVTFMDIYLNEELGESFFDIPSLYPSLPLPRRVSVDQQSEEQQSDEQQSEDQQSEDQQSEEQQSEEQQSEEAQSEETLP